MFRIGIAGIIIAVVISSLRYDFVKQWIRTTLHLKSNWWIDTISFSLIFVAATVSLYILIQTQHARKLAEESLKKAQQKIEALNSHRQPITSGHATVQIGVRSDKEVRAHVTGPGFFVEFVKGGNSVLWGGSQVYDEIQSGQGFVYYTSEFILIVGGAGVGLPVFSLQGTESIKLIAHAIPDNSEILGGGLWCTLNNSISLTFSIPAQIAKGKEIIISDIHKAFQALTPG